MLTNAQNPKTPKPQNPMIYKNIELIWEIWFEKEISEVVNIFLK